MPANLDELLQHAQAVVDDLHNNRAVYKIKDKARACVAVGSGVFEGRRVSHNAIFSLGLCMADVSSILCKLYWKRLTDIA